MITEDSYLDIEKSLSKGSIVLIAKRSWEYYSEISFTIFVLLSFSFSQIVFALECVKNPGLPDKICALILFLTSAITLFGIYRKIFQNKLEVIDHSLSKSQIKKILFNYFTEVPRNNIDENGDYIAVKKEFSYYYKVYLFIFIDGKLYFNIRNFYPRDNNPPVVFDHFLLKKDLQNLISHP